MNLISTNQINLDCAIFNINLIVKFLNYNLHITYTELRQSFECTGCKSDFEKILENLWDELVKIQIIEKEFIFKYFTS